MFLPSVLPSGKRSFGLAKSAAIPLAHGEEVFRQLLRELNAACDGANSEESAIAVERAWSAAEALLASPTCFEKVDLLNAVALGFFYQARNAQALRPAQAALDAARGVNEPKRLRRAMTLLSAVLTQAGDQPKAIEVASEGLRVADEIGDIPGRCGILNNTGLALLYSGQYEDAIECFEAALLAIPRELPNAMTRIALQANIALACLSLDDLRGGLRAARKACEEPYADDDTDAMIARCGAEDQFVRLLLESSNVTKAHERCAVAREIATKSGSARAQFMVEIAEGLTEVRDGMVDVGISRLETLLQTARDSIPSEVESVLRALVAANEDAGRLERALEYLRELMEVVRQAREGAALLHHHSHMEGIVESVEEEVSQERLLDRKTKLIEGKLASRRFRELSIESLERLAVTAELRDDSTGEHSYRVGFLASLLARDLGHDEEFVFNLDLAGRLHDIGKIGIPDHILLKPGRLTEVEFNVMRTHTTVGAELLARSDLPQMQVAEEIARHHHERWDGEGYPMKLRGEHIPVAARITALADVFDALTHVRPYKEAWPIPRALEEIGRLSGSHFDPTMTPVFLNLVRRLQHQHLDLDAYLGHAAKRSAFIQARKNIAATLRRQDEQRLLDVRR